MFGMNTRSSEEKKILEDEMMKRLLRETVRFLEANLVGNKSKEFIAELDKSGENEDAEKELRVLTKYLMKVPDVKYKLDQWMRGVLADIGYKSIKLQRNHAA
jgi:hypothetical protein